MMQPFHCLTCISSAPTTQVDMENMSVCPWLVLIREHKDVMEMLQMAAVLYAPNTLLMAGTPKGVMYSLVQVCKVNRARSVHCLAKVATVQGILSLLAHCKGHSLD